MKEFPFDNNFTFGCGYCAGTGYQDYPSCQKSCPISEHVEMHNKHVEAVGKWMKMFPEPQPTNRLCPYCKKTKCEHWTGHGWSKIPPRLKIREGGTIGGER